jgi:hypothetical protein
VALLSLQKRSTPPATFYSLANSVAHKPNTIIPTAGRVVMSVVHWLILILDATIFTIPFCKIFPRAGIPWWVGLFGCIPFVPVVFIWVLSFKKWPQDKMNVSPVGQDAIGRPVDPSGT